MDRLQNGSGNSKKKSAASRDQYQFICVWIVYVTFFFLFQLNWPFKRALRENINGRKAFIANWIKITLRTPLLFSARCACTFCVCVSNSDIFGQIFIFGNMLRFFLVCLRIFTSKSEAFLPFVWMKWRTKAKERRRQSFRMIDLKFNFRESICELHYCCVICIGHREPYLSHHLKAINQIFANTQKNTIRNISSPKQRILHRQKDLHKSSFRVHEKNFRSQFHRVFFLSIDVQWSR